MQKPVYLDHHATTRWMPACSKPCCRFSGLNSAMLRAAGTASDGSGSRRGTGPQRVAELAGAAPREIVFTSGATESDNLALKE